MAKPVGQVGRAIKAVEQTMTRPARDAQEAAAIAETRRRLRMAGPNAARLLHDAILADGIILSDHARVRWAAVTVFRYGGFEAEAGAIDAGEAARARVGGLGSAAR